MNATFEDIKKNKDDNYILRLSNYKDNPNNSIDESKETYVVKGSSERKSERKNIINRPDNIEHNENNLNIDKKSIDDESNDFHFG